MKWIGNFMSESSDKSVALEFFLSEVMEQSFQVFTLFLGRSV